jgi:hypothetical protein
LYFDGNLTRLPALDQPFEMGLGLTDVRGVAWDGNNHRFLFHRLTALENIAEVDAVPPNLKSKVRLFDLGSSGLPPGRTQRITYLPDEDLIALTHTMYSSIPLSIPPSIQLFDSLGAKVEALDLTGLSLGNNPTRIRYVLSPLHGKKFAIRFSGAPNPPALIHILNRDGTLDREIDLSATGIDGILALAYFAPSDPTGGRFLVASQNSAASHRALVTDYAGSEIGEFDYHAALNVLQPNDVEAITSGPYAGAFCMIENNEGEMIVFRLK